MIIGVYKHNLKTMREERKEALAKEAENQNVELIFFEPKDVDFDNKTVGGTVKENNFWKEKIFPFPEVLINDVPQKQENWPEEEWQLRKEIPVTSHLIEHKLNVYERIKRAGVYSDYLAPSEKVEDIASIYRYLNEYGKVVVKPLHGRRGMGVLCMEKKRNKYLLNKHTEKYKFNKKQFRQFVQKVVENDYMIQPYIECRTKEGNPYDFRVHVQRNGQGEWGITKIYPRIGAKESILSNISRGGTTYIIEEFLNYEFNNESEHIFNILCQLALDLADHVNNFYSFKLDELGIDLAIDNNKKICVHEVNAGPQTKYHEEERAVNIIAYAKYIAYQERERKIRPVLKLTYELGEKVELINRLLENKNLEETLKAVLAIAEGFKSIEKNIQPYILLENDLYTAKEAVKNNFAELVRVYEQNDKDNARQLIASQLIPNLNLLARELEKTFKQSDASINNNLPSEFDCGRDSNITKSEAVKV